MKRMIPFSKFFLPACIFSLILIVSGITGYVYHTRTGEGGFNLGVDFRAGLMQEIQFAPAAMSLGYRGLGNASVSMDRSKLDIVISGSGVTGTTYSFPYAAYGTLGDLVSGLSAVEGLEVSLSAPASAQSALLIQSSQGDPQLGAAPYRIHYLPPSSPVIAIEEVRASLVSLGGASVQTLGTPAERRFMIRVDDAAVEGNGGSAGGMTLTALEGYFGSGAVVVTKSDYVGSRFSKNLTDQAGLLLGLTLLLILLYASIRFKPQYAIGAVLAIAHDALIMVAFVTWTRMEFNTITIAAILTILGYSINDTIVIFDRIRETRRIYPDDIFVDILNRALSETLSRTIITTVTTMLAVLFLFIFTTGSMKDFALLLLVGMTSGVYSTIFIASGFVNFWDRRIKKWLEKKFSAEAVKA